ncbi:tRNA (guanosine(46)-N7)-methyltransferase TrmB [Haliea sp. E17]|uniref:tRNA (guanosine(46)-N7)-methyltransferase TrmB n=1 Tax=Haliea sp. E17 TaxID=3401576 RepID=UPI003AABA90A
MNEPSGRRPIRSYVLRTGRMTPGQQRAYASHWASWGLEHADGALDFAASFGRPGATVLEIGFGMGGSLAAMAAAAPEKNFIGVEVHRPGVGRLLHTMDDEGIGNIRVYCHDAVEVLRDCIPDASLDTVQIFFPDPWHKKRHHKRRLIQPPFVQQLVGKLKPGGVLHLATDWENYAEQMLEVLSAEPALANLAGEGNFSPRPAHRPETKFEQRGERLGHGVWDLLFEKR